MHILSQGQDTKEEVNCAVSKFISVFGIGDLLKKCNAQKQKGVPVMSIFRYKLANVFNQKSMYMQMKTVLVKRFCNTYGLNFIKFRMEKALPSHCVKDKRPDGRACGILDTVRCSRRSVAKKLQANFCRIKQLPHVLRGMPSLERSFISVV